jgi:hypothetical protein
MGVFATGRVAAEPFSSAISPSRTEKVAQIL